MLRFWGFIRHFLSLEFLKKIFEKGYLFIYLRQKTEEIEKTEYAKKGKRIAEDFSKTAGKTAESIYKQGESISKTKVFQSVSEVRFLILYCNFT